MNKVNFINRVNELKEELRKIKNSSFNFPIAMKVSDLAVKRGMLYMW